MTATYTNITLLDVPQDEAAAWLAQSGYTAAVSPMIDDITVVYDNVLAEWDEDEEPLLELLKLTSEVSYELGCTAWLVIVDDDAVLLYSLYADGDLKDSYGVKAGEAPDGGNPVLLVETFQAPRRTVKTIRALLKRDLTGPASERHAQLLDALDLLPLALRASYAAIQAGTLPEGISSHDDLMYVTADDDNA
jgi:hypothetical protein